MKITRLPGLIDIHVHLRDPGQIHKEDFYTGTCSALAGGITTVFDMPNNLNPIFSEQKLKEKEAIAGKKAVCDFGLYFGTDGKNAHEFSKVVANVVGLKLYLSLTTGRYVVGDEDLVRYIFEKWPKEKVLVVHAEGERVDLAIKLAGKLGNKLHLTHVNTREMLGKILEAKKFGLAVTCDTTPTYLFLSQEKIPQNGFYQVKPSIGTKKDQDFLWENLKYIDCLATDHAPHTKEEKNSQEPPAGVPGLETMLPLLLTAMLAGKLNLEEIIRLTYSNPQKIFGFRSPKNTLVEVDLEEKYLIENQNLKTRCGWSPFAGWEVQGKIKSVYLRGKKVFSDGKILVLPGFGKKVILQN